MNDFVFANRDGLATYIIYERGTTKGGKPIVVSGEAINIAVSEFVERVWASQSRLTAALTLFPIAVWPSAKGYHVERLL